jgi:1-phosphofructokinase family hexose kinase
MKVVTVTLNPAVDKTLVIPDFRLERVVRVSEVFIYPSGKGVNVARVLVRLGVPAICLGFIGGYAGAFLADGLSREGIEHDFTTVADETRINLTIRDPKTGLEVHLVEPGSRISEGDWHRFVETYERHLKEASWVALCGSLPPGAPSDSYAQLIQLAHKHGVPCALDTSGDALRKGVEAVPEVIKPNRQELADLSWRASGQRQKVTCLNLQASPTRHQNHRRLTRQRWRCRERRAKFTESNATARSGCQHHRFRRCAFGRSDFRFGEGTSLQRGVKVRCRNWNGEHPR